MKFVSPKLMDINESITDEKYINQKKNKDALKYIGIYRKAFRNSKPINSSRTDLIDQQS